MRSRTIPLFFALAAVYSGTAAGIEMTDYKDPKSTWEEAYLTGSFSSKAGNQEQASYNLILDAYYEHNYSSLPRTWQIYIDGKADVTRGPNDTDSTEDNSQATFEGTLDNYFKTHPNVFWTGTTVTNYRSDASDPRIEIGAGLGYGRVINATPLAKVLRIEEELREHGVIMGRISDADYLELAQIIDRENEYKSRYGIDEYKAYWFSDFEKALKRMGALRNDALGALGVLQMDNVLFLEPVSIRKHGWLVRGGVGYVLQNFEGDDSDPSLFFDFEYAHPSGYKGQFINSTKYSTIIGSADHSHYITNDMSYSHEISDRVDWINTWTLDWEMYEGDQDDIVTNGLSTTFRYYLTNRLTANATASITRTEDNIPDSTLTNPEDYNDDTDVRTFFQIAYRLK